MELNCYTDTLPSTGLNCLEDARFLNKESTQNTREIIRDWWEEQTKLYGMEVEYSVHKYNLSAHDFFYGEQPSDGFEDPKRIVILVDVSSESVLLSRFGIQTQAEFMALIPIQTFYDVFGEGAEPKSDDLIALHELGIDRPNPRTRKIFQITERADEEFNEINQLLGHYMWFIKGVRYDFSSEPNVAPEAGSDQVYDNTFAGRLSGFENPVEDEKVYDQNVTDKSKTIFDYENQDIDTNPYGEYD